MKCEICGNENFKDNGKFKGCSYCGVCIDFSNEKGVFSSADDNVENKIHNIAPKNIFVFALKKLDFLKGKEKKGKLLDIGSGTGFFMSMAQKNGWDSYGVELDQKRVSSMSENKDKVFVGSFDDMPSCENQYDAITFFSVLCLLSSPQKAVKKAFIALNDNGILVIRDYNISFHSLGFFLERFLSRFGIKPFIFHRWNFSVKSIKILLEKSGFDILSVENSPFTSGDPYSTGGRLGERFVSFIKAVLNEIFSFIALVSFGKILLAPSFIVFARKKI